MSAHSRIVAVSLVLTFFFAPAQAQEDSDTRQGEAADQQGPTEPIPLPFPVQLIEDAEAIENRRQSEEESRQREIDDLAAQQGMNAATQAMNDATQRMAKYTLWSAVLVGIGTILLFWTLCLSRQANRAAIAAVNVTREIGIVQTRSYIHVSGGGYILNKTGLNGWADICNSGNSAAINPVIEASIHVEAAWFGGALLATQPLSLEAGPFTATKPRIQPGETSRFYFHWTNEQIGDRYDSLADERNTMVVDVKLTSGTIYSGITE